MKIMIVLYIAWVMPNGNIDYTESKVDIAPNYTQGEAMQACTRRLVASTNILVRDRNIIVKTASCYLEMGAS